MEQSLFLKVFDLRTIGGKGAMNVVMHSRVETHPCFRAGLDELGFQTIAAIFVAATLHYAVIVCIPRSPASFPLRA
jgi:hypothetical protein